MREVNLLDYEHPDVTFGRRPPLEQGVDREGNPIFRTRLYDGNTFVVYARRDYVGHIFNASGGGNVWKCRACDYFPSSQQDAPPIPGQHCHNCGAVLAEWVGRARG